MSSLEIIFALSKNNFPHRKAPTSSEENPVFSVESLGLTAEASTPCRRSNMTLLLAPNPARDRLPIWRIQNGTTDTSLFKILPQDRPDGSRGSPALHGTHHQSHDPLGGRGEERA